jgi:hypothetical protein
VVWVNKGVLKVFPENIGEVLLGEEYHKKVTPGIGVGVKLNENGEHAGEGDVMDGFGTQQITDGK